MATRVVTQYAVTITECRYREIPHVVIRHQAIRKQHHGAIGRAIHPPCGFNAIGLTDTSKVFNTARIEALEVDNLIECAQATMVSAAARKECRGAHTVSDYERPADDPIAPLGRDDANWMKHTLWHSASNSLTYKPVNLKPLSVDSVPPKVRTF